MKKLMAYCSAVIFSLMLAGCGEPTVDASSPEAMKSSAEAIMEQLPEEKQAEFQQAFGGIVVMVGMAAAFQGKDEAAVQEAMRDAVDGKTADEIIAYAQELKAKANNKG